MASPRGATAPKNLVAALEQKWNTEGERRQQGWSEPYYDIC